MKFYIEKELIEVQAEHIEKEIKKVEMKIRNQYNDRTRNRELKSGKIPF